MATYLSLAIDAFSFMLFVKLSSLSERHHYTHKNNQCSPPLTDQAGWTVFRLRGDGCSVAHEVCGDALGLSVIGVW